MTRKPSALRRLIVIDTSDSLAFSTVMEALELARITALIREYREGKSIYPKLQDAMRERGELEARINS